VPKLLGLVQFLPEVSPILTLRLVADNSVCRTEATARGIAHCRPNGGLEYHSRSNRVIQKLGYFPKRILSEFQLFRHTQDFVAGRYTDRSTREDMFLLIRDAKVADIKHPNPS
jgi:hypothetical protein